MSRKKETAEEQELQPQPATETETEQNAAEPAATPAEPSVEETLQAQLKEEQDRYLRLMAEFDNFRRRTQREKETIYPDAVAATLKELLPTLDNFQRALEAPSTDEEYKKGVQMIYTGLVEMLHKQGLEEFGEPGEEFDPNRHNAVMHVEDESLDKNVVAQVFQRGYRIGDRILRYATVQQAN